MKVPINQKYMLTITEAYEYFGIGRKIVRRFVAEHPELAIHNGNRWLIFREEMENHLKHYGLGKIDERNQQNLDRNSDYQDFQYDDFDFGS